MHCTLTESQKTQLTKKKKRQNAQIENTNTVSKPGLYILARSNQKKKKFKMV